MSSETGTTVEQNYCKLEYFTEFHLFQAWTWRLTINLCNFVGKFVCVYLVFLSHFLPFKIHLINISPILIKMVDFKNLAWATSFATWASRKFIYLPTGQEGEKSYCHTLDLICAITYIFLSPCPLKSSWSLHLSLLLPSLHSTNHTTPHTPASHNTPHPHQPSPGHNTPHPHQP